MFAQRGSMSFLKKKQISFWDKKTYRRKKLTKLLNHWSVVQYFYRIGTIISKEKIKTITIRLYWEQTRPFSSQLHQVICNHIPNQVTSMPRESSKKGNQVKQDQLNLKIYSPILIKINFNLRQKISKWSPSIEISLTFFYG